MKTLDLGFYNVQELNIIDTIKIDGGNNPAYDAGHAAGVWARKIVDDIIIGIELFG